MRKFKPQKRPFDEPVRRNSGGERQTEGHQCPMRERIVFNTPFMDNQIMPEIKPVRDTPKRHDKWKAQQVCQQIVFIVRYYDNEIGDGSTK